ncbi:putative efflux pump membrane fusion protein [Rubripirellula lacrimiformis]|uniref:Putative efflux pump membrane fusion protein n=1 Tax=Rubripirellula lacrimiformis TaxID=1930273 RepID=A0A517N4Q2_9BACT|nr:HlyD family efflux transporter periplasmic adaptor subunit [Rubripirellula lacrimiformis]QDT02115.1 putative efflux pump membrane fusion protein [Rubripirellula lacrimiformis]
MTRRMGSRIGWWIVIAGIGGLIAYGFIPQPIEVETAAPTIGSLAISVNDDGETRIREKYVLSAPVSGKMLRVELDAGDPVMAGQTEIARIQPSDPSLLDARTRAEAQARVRVTTAAYGQAYTVVNRAEEALKLAEQEFERAQKLLPNRAISQSEYDAAENRLRLARADVRSAESALRVAQYEIDQAEATVRYIKSTFDPNDDNFFTLVSPISGKVLEVYREDSGVIASGTPVVRIGDPTDLELVIDVLSTDAVKVQPGSPVIVEHWGGDAPLDAVVRLVEPSAFLKVSALGVEEKRVNVIADFVSPFEDRESLGDGYRIEAQIIIDETPTDALKVPAGVLFRDGERWQAYRVVAGLAELVTVDVGRSNGMETEIIAGLSPDDVLVMHPTEAIQPGAKVAPQSDLPPRQ